MKCKVFSVNFIDNPAPLENLVNQWLEEEKIGQDNILDMQMTSNFIEVESKVLFKEGDDTKVPVLNVTTVLFYKPKRRASKKKQS